MSPLAELWKEHQGTAYPATALRISIDGLALITLDARAGAILTASLRTDGHPRPLPDEVLEELRRYRDLAAKALSEIPLDGPSHDYFTRLVRLSTALLTPTGG